MSKKISAAEHPLSKIFSSDFEYIIPSYQRPYAWGILHTYDLFDDLYDFYKSEIDEGYFLGSIVLIKQENNTHSEVIDGQQRLTTLTILLAAMASKMTGESQDRLKQYIREPGNHFEGLKSKPRLTLRDRDKDFFEKYVQSLDFDGLLKLDPETLSSEAQKNIYKNSNSLLLCLDKKFGDSVEELTAFVRFILQRCFLVTVSTPSQKSAFRVFSVMNTRGMSLQATDIIKADIIGKIDDQEQQDEYNERWEDMEVELGREGFNDLFGYVRMIYNKDKAKRAILDEFRTHVLSKITSPTELIEKVLEPYADALATLKNANYEASSNAQDINGYLKWLNRIDNSDWLPPAIQFLSQHKHNPEYVLWFFKKLERLAAYMHVCAKNINERISRYADLLEGLEKTHSMELPVSSVELRDDEKLSMMQALDGNIYDLTARRRNYLILRLDAFLSDGGASYDPNILTIEHVLPQTVDEDSQWASIWPIEEVRKEWVHRIANLVPLNRRRNSQARNFDFDRKKSAYFTGKSGVSSYALTTQVLNSSEWSPEFIEKRQVELLDALNENWELAEE
ncbi:MAG: hypothetical protein COA96_01305 [SAR86 cluster bacterium]|uniref:DUF262 domain-containing protein n=1 Tax=SAR86 cluster bacterium TaxID=2030880 RepID=A0A2A5B9A4_9GAMM|nr:MAG: hypothetical protein COA96_01305 [SAR86 cluster bacterium]